MPGLGNVDGLALLLVVGALGAALTLVVHARPRAGYGLYLAVLCLVPPWVAVPVGVLVTPLMAIGLAIIVATWAGSEIRLLTYDVVTAVVIGSVAVSFLLGYVTLTQAYAAIVGWGLPYLVGRLGTRVGTDWLSTCIAVVFFVVAVLAVVEFVGRRNWFVEIHFPNSMYEGWAGIRYRGGMPRVEGAFGNSIALGACLAMAVPFVWVSRLRPVVKAVVILTLAAAAVMTFSRIGMLSVVLGVVLCVTLLGGRVSRGFRIATASLLVVGVAIAAPLAMDVFTSAGDEAQGSAEYRGDLLSLVPTMTWLGQSSASARDAAGTQSFGSFESIDSAIILVGLTYGLIPLALLLVSAVAAVVAVVRGHRGPAMVAVLAILPGLTSVAFITQFTTFFWFVVGLAVAQHHQERRARDEGPEVAPDLHKMDAFGGRVV